MKEKLTLFFSTLNKIVFDFPSEVRLDDPSACYFIEEGSAEIYILNKKDNKKHFLVELPEKRLIFGIKSNPDFSVVAHLENKSILRKGNLNKILDDEKLLSQILSSFDEWIYTISDRLFVVKNRRADLYIVPKIRYEAFDGKLFSFKVDPKDRSMIFWYRLNEGKFSFKGHLKDFVEPLSIFPVISKFWAKALSSPLLVERITLLELLQKDRDVELLSRITEKLLSGLFFDFIDKQKRENKRILLKIGLEKSLLKKTTSLLLSLLWRKKPFIYISNHSPIVQAFETVAKNMDIDVRLPRFFSDIENYKQTINEIADSSSIRIKKIIFEKKWWKKDIGHFIGFKNGLKKPVALLKKFNGYIYFDPESGETKKISKQNSSEILLNGFTLYKSLPNKKPSLKEIFSFAFKGKKKELFFQLFLGVLIISFNFSIPLASGLIFKRIIPFLDQNLLLHLFFGLVLISLSLGVFLLISGILALHIQAWVQFILQSALWDKLLKLHVSFFSRYSLGNLIRRSFAITLIQNVFNNTFFIYVFTALFSVFYLIVMFYYSARLALIGFSVVLLGCLVLALLYKKIIKLDIDKVELSSEYNGFLVQVIKGIEKIRLTALEKIIYSRWGQKYYDYTTVSIESKKIGVFASAWNDSLSIFSIIIIFFVGLRAIQNNLPISDFIAFNVAFGMFSFSIFRGVNALGSSLGTVIPFWKQARSIINESDEHKAEMVEPDKLMGYIEVDSLSFKYEGSEFFVLHEISLKVAPGEFVAIVGPSGCGKSTLFRLLFQFYAPNSGAIYYDGNDLATLDALKLRKQLGIVLQDSNLLAGTIYDNLLVQEGISQQEIDEAMKLSGFDKVIDELPMKYFTYLSEGGKNLSGGQKQQLLIARSLLRKPQILFLDEATNSLDNQAQSQITSNIKNLKMTRVVIAHRLSSVRAADRIYVMNEGRIIEQGSWDELVALNGLFASLLEKQKI